MKIEYTIAGGHKRGELTGYKLKNPALTDEQAVAHWVQERFGPRLVEAIGSDFDIYETTDSYFLINWPSKADGLQFLTLFGGNVLEK